MLGLLPIDPEMAAHHGLGAAVRGLTINRDQEVLTGSGIFIAKSAETRRSQRSRWPQPRMLRIAGRHRACARGVLCLAPAQSCVARQGK